MGPPSLRGEDMAHFFLLIVIFGTVSMTEGLTCRPGYEAPFKNSYSCYRFVTHTVNWFDAEDSCRRDGAHLVSIETKEEQAHLVNYIFSRPELKKARVGYWTSAADMVKNGNTFVWKGTGWPMKYKAFDSGEPNNYGGRREECVHLRPPSYLWNDEVCTRSYGIGYICEQHAHICKHGNIHVFNHL